MKHGFMNLAVGGYYLLIQMNNYETPCRIVSRRENDYCHVYLVEWPHPTRPNPYGIYKHDYGRAKLVKEGEKLAIFSFSTEILGYRPLNESELRPMKLWFQKREERKQAWLRKVEREAFLGAQSDPKRRSHGHRTCAS